MESNLSNSTTPSAKFVSSLDLPCNNSVYPRTTKAPPSTSNTHRGDWVMQKSEKEQMNFVDQLTPVLNVAYRVAIHLTNDRSDAEDLVQEATLQVFRRFDTFQVGTNFKAWYLKILKNCFLMEIRKQNSRPPRDPKNTADDSIHAQSAIRVGVSETDGPADTLMRDSIATQFAEAMQSLPHDYRLVCVYSLVQELSYQEIAQQLEIPIGTVRSRLHRGRKLLQNQLRHLVAEAESIETEK